MEGHDQSARVRMWKLSMHGRMVNSSSTGRIASYELHDLRFSEETAVSAWF